MNLLRALKGRPAVSNETGEQSPVFVSGALAALTRHCTLPNFAVLLGALVALVYGQTAGFEFVTVWDDGVYITKNPGVTGGLTWANVQWAWTSMHTGSVWSPLLWILFQAQYSLFGAEHAAMGMHLVNTSLLWLTGVVLFGLVRRLSGDALMGAAVAFCFCLSPLSVESTAWVTELKNVGSMPLMLAALWAYIAIPSRNGMVAASLLGVMAMLIKPAVIVLPGLMLTVDYLVLHRLSWWRGLATIPLWVAGVFVGLMAIQAEINGGSYSLAGTVPLSLQSLAVYVGQTLLPIRLCYSYYGALALAPWMVAAGGAILVALVGAAVRYRQRKPLVTFGVLWYLGALALVIGYPRLIGNSPHADRLYFAAMAGLMLAIAAWLPRRGLLVMCLMALPWTYLSYQQAQTWRDSKTLILHAYRYYPHDLISVQQVMLPMEAEEAIEFLRAELRYLGLSRDQDRVGLYYLLHERLAKSGRAAEAAECLDELMRTRPASSGIYRSVLRIAEKYGLPRAQSEWQRVGVGPDDRLQRQVDALARSQ